jgi:hypothetical protein
MKATSVRARRRTKWITALAISLALLDGSNALPFANLHKERGQFLFSKLTTISGQIVETHDRISPGSLRGIVWQRNFTFVLGAANDVRETWSNTRTDDGAGSGGTEDHNASGIKLSLGVNNPSVEWHVLGENQLQRINKQGDSVSIMTITLGPDNRCAVTRTWATHVGTMLDDRSKGGTTERFTPWRTINAQCKAE